MSRTSEPPLLTRAFGLLVGGHFLQALGYSSMILLPLYLDWLGASRTEVGAVMATGVLGGLVSRPLVGAALDRWGRKPVLNLGTLVLVAGMFAIGGVVDLGPLIWLARLLVGTGIGMLFAAYFTFAADLVPSSRRTEGLALFGISGLVPLATNPLADAVGVEPGMLRWYFPVMGGLIALSLLFLAPLEEPERPPQIAPTPTAEVLRALRARPLWPVWWATALFGGLVMVFMSFVTVAAEARGLEEPAMLWLTYAGGAVGVRLLGARLPDRVGPSRILPPAVLAYAGAFLLAAFSDTGSAFLVAGGLAGLGHGYCFPVLAGQTFTRSPQGLRGSAMATFTALWDAAALGLVPLAGIWADAVGDRAMLASTAGLAVAGLVVWALLEHRHAPR